MEHVIKTESTQLGSAAGPLDALTASSLHDCMQLPDYSHNYTESEPDSNEQIIRSNIAGTVASSMHNSTMYLQLQQFADFDAEQQEAAVGAVCPTPTNAARKLFKSRGHRHGRRGTAKSQLVCKVDSCNTVLSSSKAYYQRHRVCAAHLACMSAPVDGVESRFCQQCGKFQPLEEFDNDKRSCRSRLKRHNNRRREQRHSKNVSFHSCPQSPNSRLDYMTTAGDPGLLDPHNSDRAQPQGLQCLSGSGVGLKPPQFSPNQSGEHSSSAAAIRLEASPGTPAGPPNATAATAAAAGGGSGGGSGGITGQSGGLLLGGRLSVRRSSASKAMEAFKSMNASSNSTASEFEDDNMEEAHQRSPMMAAAAAAAALICRPRRKLDLDAATAAAAAADGQNMSRGFRAHNQGLPGPGTSLHPHRLGIGGGLGGAELAAAVQAAAVGGMYNKCAQSAAGSSGSNDLGFGSRPHVGLSRFAVQNPGAATAGLDCLSQQPLLRQQWEQHASAVLQHSHSIGFRGQYPQSSMAPMQGPGSCNAPPGSNAVGTYLAQQHSAPPFLLRGGSGGHSDSDCDPRSAVAAVAGRYSEAGLRVGGANLYSGQPQHQQQQQLQPPVDTYIGIPWSATAVQRYSGSNPEAPGDNVPAHTVESHQQQQQQQEAQIFDRSQWQAAAATSGYDDQAALSLQVLAQLRNSDTLPGSPMSDSPVLQQQSQKQQQLPPFSVPRGQYLTSQGSGCQPAASAGTAVPVTATTGHLNSTRVTVSPFQIAMPQPQLLIGRPYASFSGAEGHIGGLSEGPSVSLTAPLRANLAGFSLGHSSNMSGWPGGSQMPGQQQQQQKIQHVSSWPGSHPVHHQQQHAMQSVLVKQGSVAAQHRQLRADADLAVDSPTQMFVAALESEANDRWMEDSTHAQQVLQQQQNAGLPAAELQPCVMKEEDNAWTDTCRPGTATQEFACTAAQDFSCRVNAAGQQQAYAEGPAAEQLQYYQEEGTVSRQHSAVDSAALRRLPSAGTTGYPDASVELAGGSPSQQCHYTHALPSQKHATMQAPASRTPSSAGDALDVALQLNLDGRGQIATDQLTVDKYPNNAADAHTQVVHRIALDAAMQHERTQGAAEASPATPAEYDPSMMHCMSTDEDFGDLLDLLLEGEAAQQ